MGLFKLLGALAVLVAAAAYFTKPGPEDVETALKQALYDKLFTTEVDAGRDMLGNAAILGCRLDPEFCYQLLRQGLEVEYRDKLLFARVTVEGFGRRASCTGAFTRFACPGGFTEAPQG